MGVQEFNKLPSSEIPRELFDLDILDGSPPCSSFSMSGSREKKWGKKTHFREGQAEQVLDDLFFHFIETARKLQPKIVIAENVKGLIIGKAKGYVKQIREMFNLAGYDVQLFLLNSAFMGVPQRRERTFFIARRKGLKLDEIALKFNQAQIPFKTIQHGSEGKPLAPAHLRLWKHRTPKDNDFGPISERIDGKLANWNSKFVHSNEACLTLTSSVRPILYDEPRHINDQEVIAIQSFPSDYNFKESDPGYICGMSVPPIMMANIARQIQIQWLDKLKSREVSHR